MRAGGRLGELKVEGRIAGEWVQELAREVGRALAAAPTVVLDMSGVTYVDQAGVDLLRTLRERGAELTECSRFVRVLLNGGVE